jgi:hypothetical protein
VFPGPGGDLLIWVYAVGELILLALAGLVIAVAGAFGPATWAARTRRGG